MLALPLRRRIARLVVFAAQFEGALDAVDPQHRLAAVGADHLDALRAGLADPDQLALAIDVEYRRAREQADHEHLGRGQRGQRENAGKQGDAQPQHDHSLGGRIAFNGA